MWTFDVGANLYGALGEAILIDAPKPHALIHYIRQDLEFDETDLEWGVNVTVERGQLLSVTSSQRSNEMGATRTLRCIQYEPTQLIITALERLHREGVREATLADVVIEATRINQPLAVKVFFTRNRRDDVLTSDGDINEPALNDPTVYKTGSTSNTNTNSTTSASSPPAAPTPKTLC